VVKKFLLYQTINNPEYTNISSEFIEYLPGSLATYHTIYLILTYDKKYVETVTEIVEYIEQQCVNLKSMNIPTYDDDCYSYDENYKDDDDDELYITYRYKLMLYNKHKNLHCECDTFMVTNTKTDTKTVINTKPPILGITEMKIDPSITALELPIKQPELKSPEYRLNILRIIQHLGGLAFSPGCTESELLDDKMSYKFYSKVFEKIRKLN
jgi:hypothetical protein